MVRLLPIPEVRGSNPVIGKFLYWTFTVNCIEKTNLKKKRPGMTHFFKKNRLNFYAHECSFYFCQQIDNKEKMPLEKTNWWPCIERIKKTKWFTFDLLPVWPNGKLNLPKCFKKSPKKLPDQYLFEAQSFQNGT